MLARAPHSLRAQVARIRVTPSARFVHGHGEYHVRVLRLPPVQHPIYSLPSTCHSSGLERNDYRSVSSSPLSW